MFIKSKVGKTSKKKKSAVAETARYYKLPAGDNSAERTVGCIKGTVRRLGNLGSATQKKHQKSVQSMCSAALYRQAGLQSVLEALIVYRQACSDGTLYMVPKDAWKHDKCTWLFTCLKQDASNRVQAKETSSVRANSWGGGGRKIRIPFRVLVYKGAVLHWGPKKGTLVWRITPI